MLLIVILLKIKQRSIQPANHAGEQLLLASDYKLLGDWALERGKNQLAERCYRQFAMLEPYNTDIHYEFGKLLFQSGRYQEAIREFTLYLKNEIILPDVYFYLGYAYLMIQNLSKAEEYYQRAFEMTPNNPDILLGLGVIMQKRDQYQEAKQHYENALLLDPNLEEARQNLRDIQPYL